MEYFDLAIKEKKYALEHSSDPWKEHKYIDKIVKGGKTLYRYAITGQGYKDDAEDYKRYADKKQEESKKYESSRKEYNDRLINEKYNQIRLIGTNPNAGEAEQALDDYLKIKAAEQEFNNNPSFKEGGTGEQYLNALAERDQHRYESAVKREEHENAINKSKSEEQRLRNISNLYRNKQINSKKEAENDYYSKSLKGISESLISKGDDFIKKLFGK